LLIVHKQHKKQRMKTISLSGSLRADVGSTNAKAVRLAGHVPCVIYGGKDQKFFQVDLRHIEKCLTTPEVYCFNLDIAGEKRSAIVQEVQFHPITDAVTHVDFLEVDAKKAIRIGLPFKIVGNSEGVKAGGKLVKGLRKIKVEGFLENIPDTIEVDVTALNIGNSVKIKDLKLANVKLLDAPNVVVARVEMTRAAAAAAAEAAKAASTPAKKKK
jgi:large subunit ribosomal protein L25